MDWLPSFFTQGKKHTMNENGMAFISDLFRRKSLSLFIEKTALNPQNQNLGVQLPKRNNIGEPSSRKKFGYDITSEHTLGEGRGGYGKPFVAKFNPCNICLIL